MNTENKSLDITMGCTTPPDNVKPDYLERMKLTLFAKRNNTSVDVYNDKGVFKGSFPNTGYRPTRATKKITLNCWEWKLEWY